MRGGGIERVMAPVRKPVSWLSSLPIVWNLFRRILELNFAGEKRVIRRELELNARRIMERGRRPVVLDLGCGTGEFAPVFLKAGYTYAGIDIEPERIKYARKTYRKARFYVMDATSLKYKDSYFDQILITGVLHHLPDPVVRGIMGEMKRVLKPGGRALVMEDIVVSRSENPLGALVHLADEGEYIRRPAQYAPLFQPEFEVRASYPVRSGVCDYQVFVLEPAGEK